MATELAKAYVQIVPSAQGMKGKLTTLMDGEAARAGESGGDKYATGFGDAAKAGVAKAGAAIAAGAAAVGSIVKSAVSEYADYEQLVGGVETLFKDSAGIVQDYAANAYQTAGLSANDYMETVTSFSASLLQSLDGDTAAAAQAADTAITDMADNANKMGSSMESIQNAYQGFAKQNYTMLDNLKLGYGGTKEEMERLLADAEEISGIHYDISELDDVYAAIHVVQTELGITGTTAQEASSTISGSFGMMTASWQNLLVGLADGNADMSSLIDSLVGSATTFVGNLTPVIEQALLGIGTLVTGLAPTISEQLPVLVETVLPGLLSAAVSLIEALGSGIMSALPSLIPVAVEVVMTLVNDLASNVGLLVDSAATLLTGLADGLIQAIPQMVPAVLQIILGIVTHLLENIPQLITSGIQLIVALAQGLVQAIPQLVAALPQIVSAVVRGLGQLTTQLPSIGLNAIRGLWNGMSNALGWLIEQIRGLCSSALGAIKSFFGIHSPSTVFAGLGENLMLGLAGGIADSSGAVTDALQDVAGLTTGTMSGRLQVSAARSTAAFSAADGYGSAGSTPDVTVLASAIRAALQGTGVYIDGRTAVGYIDTALGARTIAAGRGVTYA